VPRRRRRPSLGYEKCDGYSVTCRLTLVVDESFAEFRDRLNKEYVAAALDNGDGGPAPDNADKETTVRRREDKFSSSEFAQLWKRIRYKARYRVTLNPAVLPGTTAKSEYLDRIADLAHRANVVQAADLVYGDQGRVITTESAGSAIGYYLQDGKEPRRPRRHGLRGHPLPQARARGTSPRSLTSTAPEPTAPTAVGSKGMPG
jgi:hypothetical protein